MLAVSIHMSCFTVWFDVTAQSRWQTLAAGRENSLDALTSAASGAAKTSHSGTQTRRYCTSTRLPLLRRKRYQRRADTSGPTHRATEGYWLSGCGVTAVFKQRCSTVHQCQTRTTDTHGNTINRTSVHITPLQRTALQHTAATVSRSHARHPLCSLPPPPGWLSRS